MYSAGFLARPGSKVKKKEYMRVKLTSHLIFLVDFDTELTFDLSGVLVCGFCSEKIFISLGPHLTV